MYSAFGSSLLVMIPNINELRFRVLNSILKKNVYLILFKDLFVHLKMWHLNVPVQWSFDRNTTQNFTVLDFQCIFIFISFPVPVMVSRWQYEISIQLDIENVGNLMVTEWDIQAIHQRHFLLYFSPPTAPFNIYII